MVYQKKMLILSGDGKGVVLIEKSAGGTTFSLRTFDLRAYSSPLKVGIVTRSHVVVRDLPAGDDPALAFALDVGDISELHFAVFDDGLRLYGTNTKRMWEANLMDLLSRHDRKPPLVAERPTPPALPPLSLKPEVLPMPDGTGIPQTRLSLYGDEAIAENDFYTTLDISSRMPVVDSFLDSPRVLDDRIAPRVQAHKSAPPPPVPPPPSTPPVAEPSLEPVVSSEVESQTVVEPQAVETYAESVEPDRELEARAAEEFIGEDNIRESSVDAEAQTRELGKEDGENRSEEVVEEIMKEPVQEKSVAVEANDGDIFETLPDDIEQFTPSVSSPIEPVAHTVAPLEPPHMPDPSVIPMREQKREPDESAVDLSAEAAAVAGELSVTAETAAMPWEMEALWLKKRSHRTPVVKKREVKPIKATEQIKRLRECAFFERVRADVQTLFASAPKDEELNGLLPDLEWVRVDFDGKRISVGRSGNSVLCYAVSGGYERNSPLGGEAQWLPTDRNTPTGKGYWLIFQNMTTGEIIEN